MRTRAVWYVGLGLFVCFACRADRTDRNAASGAGASVLRGAVMTPALAKPELVLTDTQGQSYDFRRETEGAVALLFFGYTYCPDACPIHMANIAAVLKQLPPTVTSRIKVVFVTTDPKRDTPERLRSWLDNFDSSFVGLSGDPAAVAAAERALYLPAAQIGEPDSTGNYEVGHAAAVVAFSPDGLARVMYPLGTRQADWAHDLPLLVEGKT